jgi:transposase InsO family protein
MNSDSNAKLTPLSRAELVKRIVEVAAGFGLSVRSAQKWLARFRADDTAGLENLSSRPKRSPDGIHRLRVLRVLALRRRKLPGFQIARLAKLSKASVSRILRRHGAFLAELSQPPAIRRYEREQPGDLLHFDIRPLARFIQTALRSWAYAHAYRDSSQRADRLPSFLHNYNWHRPHHSLNLLPPVSRLYLHMNNLLSLHS